MKQAAERSIMQYNISATEINCHFRFKKEKENVMKSFSTADIIGSTLVGADLI